VNPKAAILQAPAGDLGLFLIPCAAARTPVSAAFMRFPAPLIPGRLLQRYKRFLADVVLDSGESITASCPNTGSMLGLAQPGSRIWLSRSDSPTRKYAHTWEITEAEAFGRRALVGINTGHPNRIVEDAVRRGVLPALTGYGSLRREVKYGQSSRIDILLEDDGLPPAYVEVKNVHLLRSHGLAEFPDCRTERGVKHLDELARVAQAGGRGVMVYLVQRADADAFALAADLDPDYAAAFKRARKAGVEAFALGCDVTPEGIMAQRLLPIEA
jgi:sugar fermentation stimulation protein A